MDYIVNPIAWLIKWSFDHILVPIGELPTIINPNTLFIIVGFVGLFYWLRTQVKYNHKAQREGGLK
ncbi:MAG TPA: hypothetical protein VKY29_00830 [Cryomorphaceae bacterium]|nr:hypothetical protein [Cryomorphaceae bacterium]